MSIFHFSFSQRYNRVCANTTDKKIDGEAVNNENYPKGSAEEKIAFLTNLSKIGPSSKQTSSKLTYHVTARSTCSNSREQSRVRSENPLLCELELVLVGTSKSRVERDDQERSSAHDRHVRQHRHTDRLCHGGTNGCEDAKGLQWN